MILGVVIGSSFTEQFVCISCKFGLSQSRGLVFKLLGVDPAVVPGDFFKGCYFYALAVFDLVEVLAGFHQAASGCVIELSKAAAQHFHFQVIAIDVGLVDASGFHIPASAGLDFLGDVDHVILVAVQACDGIRGSGLGGLFFSF
mgnify:FL=1